MMTDMKIKRLFLLGAALLATSLYAQIPDELSSFNGFGASYPYQVDERRCSIRSSGEGERKARLEYSEQVLLSFEYLFSTVPAYDLYGHLEWIQGAAQSLRKKRMGSKKSLKDAQESLKKALSDNKNLDGSGVHSYNILIEEYRAIANTLNAQSSSYSAIKKDISGIIAEIEQVEWTQEPPLPGPTAKNRCGRLYISTNPLVQGDQFCYSKAWFDGDVCYADPVFPGNAGMTVDENSTLPTPSALRSNIKAGFRLYQEQGLDSVGCSGDDCIPESIDDEEGARSKSLFKLGVESVLLYGMGETSSDGRCQNDPLSADNKVEYLNKIVLAFKETVAYSRSTAQILQNSIIPCLETRRDLLLTQDCELNGNCFELCEEDPSAAVCIPLCRENPTASACVAICEKNPESPACQAMCEQNPTAPACVAICKKKPESSTCQAMCEQNPTAPACVAILVICEQKPESPACQAMCEQNPTAPACVAMCEQNPTAPACVAMCEQNPTAPACVAICERNPQASGCQRGNRGNRGRNSRGVPSDNGDGTRIGSTNQSRGGGDGDTGNNNDGTGVNPGSDQGDSVGAGTSSKFQKLSSSPRDLSGSQGASSGSGPGGLRSSGGGQGAFRERSGDKDRLPQGNPKNRKSLSNSERLNSSPLSFRKISSSSLNLGKGGGIAGGKQSNAAAKSDDSETVTALIPENYQSISFKAQGKSGRKRIKKKAAPKRVSENSELAKSIEKEARSPAGRTDEGDSLWEQINKAYVRNALSVLLIERKDDGKKASQSIPGLKK